MDISVIIVNTNNRAELEACLQSLSGNAKTASFEVIIANNSPDERLEDLATTYAQLNVRIVDVGSNKGYGHACNQGAQHARGELLLISNPDVLYQDTTLADILSHFRNHPSTGVASPLLLVPPNDHVQPFSFGKELTPMRTLTRKFFPTEQELLDRIAPGHTATDWVAGTVMAIPSALYHQLGGFDEQFFLYFEDNDLCRRAKKEGKEIALLHWTPVVHTGHEGEHGKTTRAVNKQHKQWYYTSQLQYVRKHFGVAGALFVRILQLPKRIAWKLR